MASPLNSGKATVDLAGKAAPGSRIRRDPPPVVKRREVRHPDSRDAQIVVIGVISFAIAIVIIVIGFGDYIGS